MENSDSSNWKIKLVINGDYMIKKNKKILIIILILFCIISNFIGISYAAEDYWIDPGDYKPGTLTNADEIANMGNIIIGIIQFVGSFSSVIVLIIIGLKYMMGSLEERAEYKKTMGPYVIGAILVFATTNILGIIKTIADNVNR